MVRAACGKNEHDQNIATSSRRKSLSAMICSTLVVGVSDVSLGKKEGKDSRTE